MKIKDKIKILFIIIFIVFLIIPIILQYIGYKHEPFQGDNMGQWKLVLRQTYDNVYNIKKGESVNANTLAKADYFDNNIQLNKYNIKYKTDTTNESIKTVQYYKILGYQLNNTKPTLNMEWRQNDIIGTKVEDYSSIASSNFKGLVIDNDVGIYKALLETELDIPVETDSTKVKTHPTILGVFNKQPGDEELYWLSTSTGYYKLELFVWDPQPDNITEKIDSIHLSIPGNAVSFNNLAPSRVNMSNIQYYSRTDNKSITAPSDAYSYCFGKVLCSDPSYNIVYNNGTIQPFCDIDKRIPVYCSGSSLYNTDPTLKSVTFKDMYNDASNVTLDVIGEYLDSKSYTFDGSPIEYTNQKNAFRGLTRPFVETTTKSIKYNDLDKIVRINDNTGGYIDQRVCELLDNQLGGYDLDPTTTIKDECYKTHPIVIPTQKEDPIGPTGKDCIANYGEPLHNTKYVDYVCGENEVCYDYVCGKKFGTCKAIV